jgi:hypothetical protein
MLVACGSDGPAANLRPTTTVAAGEVAPTPTDTPTATAAPIVTEPAPIGTEPAPIGTEPAPIGTEPAPIGTEPAPIAPTPDPTTPIPPPEPNPVVPDEQDWLQALLVIGGLLLAAVVVGVLIVRSRRSETDPSVSSTSSQSSLLTTSQWITDQLSLELMAAPPAAALQRWALERSRLDNVAIGAQQQYLEAKDANWQPLAQTMSALAAALDTNLQLRAQNPPNAQLIDESTAVVNRQRAALQQLNAAVWPTIDR